MKRLFLFVTGCVVSAGMIAVSLGMSHVGTDGIKAGSLLAFNQASKPNQSSPIEVEKLCHIKLVKKVILASERPGIIDYVKPKEGDTVEADSLIIELRSDVAKAALASAKLKAKNDIDVRFAESQRNVSNAEYERIFQAWKKRPVAVPESELQTAELKLIRSDLQIEQAKIQMEIDELARQEAEALLKSFQIRAPWKGVVTKLNKKFRGEAVSQGEPILEMANTEYVQIEAFVPLKDVQRIKPGCLVEVRLSVEEEVLEIEKITFRGTVVFVDVTAVPVEHTVLVKAKVKNPDNILRENLYATMTIYPDRDGPKFEDEE